MRLFACRRLEFWRGHWLRRTECHEASNTILTEQLSHGEHAEETQCRWNTIKWDTQSLYGILDRTEKIPVTPVTVFVAVAACLCLCPSICLLVCLSIYLSVCLYVCFMNLCIYVRIYVCIIFCMYICIHACLYVRLYACMHSCLYVCMYPCVFLYGSTYLCIYSFVVH